jgi:hypothetical protein
MRIVHSKDDELKNIALFTLNVRLYGFVFIRNIFA